MGARIVEKHFTLNKNYSDFRDHQLSSDVFEFRQLVDDIRSLEMMLGNGQIKMQMCESEQYAAMRRSIAAARDLQAGSYLTMNDLTWVRPGIGIPPGNESLVIGHQLKQSLKQGELITLEYLV